MHEMVDKLHMVTMEQRRWRVNHSRTLGEYTLSEYMNQMRRDIDLIKVEIRLTPAMKRKLFWYVQNNIPCNIVDFTDEKRKGLRKLGEEILKQLRIPERLLTDQIKLCKNGNIDARIIMRLGAKKITNERDLARDIRTYYITFSSIDRTEIITVLLYGRNDQMSPLHHLSTDIIQRLMIFLPKHDGKIPWNESWVHRILRLEGT